MAKMRKIRSVDIDDATKSLYPHDARWDYAVGYKDHAYFVEVHPANTSKLKTSPQYRSLALHKLVLTTNPFTMR